MWFAARCAGRVQEAESRSVLADFPLCHPRLGDVGEPQADPVGTFDSFHGNAGKRPNFIRVISALKASIDCALGKKLQEIRVTGLARWWISRGGGGSQPPGRQNSLPLTGRALSKNGLICAVNSYYLACGFSTPSWKRIRRELTLRRSSRA